MARHWTEIVVTSDRSRQVIDLTDEVNRQIVLHNLLEGLCLLHVQHTTAAITVGEMGEGTEEDVLDVLFEIVPKLPFRHRHNPGHAPAHMISSIIGTSLSLPIAQGKLAFGTVQSVLFLELDGPQERTVHLQFLAQPTVHSTV